MMFADLIDLEDFANRLRELGLALPVGADAALIENELQDWLEGAPQDGLAAVKQMVSELERESRGLMLPSVAAMVENVRARIH
ncbi:MAG: hypothetical protein CMI01_03305 [Oceanospirillaceae bacterium]|uniref:hypothetical protein n=1 Tax=Marinobacterium litorale TaxID=404770 RepID=UPI0004080980|nr:hypothetical protein [Marinobacterium litorale]MBS97689.1 hypothetical protein [Oceanospirillaceae bacterium]